MIVLSLALDTHIMVLYKVNDNLKENVKITLILYAIGVVSGIVIEMTGLVF